MRFQTKLVFLMGSLLIVVILLLVYSFQYMAAQTLKQQIGQQALFVAQTAALNADIQEAFAQPQPWRTIQPIAEKIRTQTHAEYVVVGNEQAIRYSHPIPARIGQKIQGGDLYPPLHGQPIVSEATGSLGPSLRAIVPIFGADKKQLGILLVGYSIQDVQSAISSYRTRILIFGVIALLIGIVGTLNIARSVLRSIFGLEPEEIGRLYQEKTTILETIREGIIAIDKAGTITMANRTAVHMLGCHEEETLEQKSILEMNTGLRLLDVVHTGLAEYDQELMIGNQVLVINRLPIRDTSGQVIGAVCSLRNRSDLYRLAEELSNVRVYSEALRAQTHEYNNKLYTISGLLQLKSYQEAIEFISHESDFHQNLIRFVMQEIPDPMIGGLLIGKVNRAHELKVDLRIDPESSFRDLPAQLDRNHLIRIMGNLIDNALEAVLHPQVQTKLVNVFLTDLGSDLIFEVEDTGLGLSEETMARMFELGYSTKAEQNHGFGLALVQQSLEQLHGYVTFEPGVNGGTIFTVAIPKGDLSEQKGEE